MNIKFKIFIFLIFVFYTFKHLFAHELKKNEINTLIKNFILENPQIIEKTLQNLNLKRSEKTFLSAMTDLKKVPNPRLKNTNSDITIYEFFDYNCGYCKSVVNTIMDVISEDKKVDFVFVELPILSQSSYIAATAALAAENQGLYNDFHLSLMKKKGRITEDVIFNIAEKTGLNINQLKIDMRSKEIENKLKKNRDVAKLLNLNGTPAFIIGDIIYPGALQKSNLKQMITSFREK